MPKLIVTSRYIKPNAHKRFGNYIKYIATREGVEKLTQNHELNREKFINYLDSRPNSHGLFSETDDPIVLDKAAKEVANHTGAIWTHIVSLRRDDAERMGYNTLEAWKDLVRRRIADIASAQKISAQNIRWYAAFHNKESNPHVHIVVYSADSHEGYLTKYGIEKIRSAFANDIYHDELQNLYARVSSDSEDQLNSFNAQIRYYTEMLHNSNNAVFVDMYADEGISGTSTTKREDFQRLMNDCRKGKIDRILTKSVSRFARNTKDCLEAIRELKTLGVSVYFEKENIDTAELSSETLLTLYSQFAQEESMSISRNCRMGVHKRMMDGSYKTAKTPFGYDYVNGKLQINPEKAKVVKQIFTWYISGIGMNEIAVRLNKLGIRKEVWRRTTIHCILTNEKYIGDTLLQKTFMTDTLPFKCVMNRGEKEKYYVSGTHEPIIEESVFNSAQKVLAERYKSSETVIERSAFSSKIICGNCGSTFKRKTRKNRIYWVCRKHDNSAENCSIKQISETDFRSSFIRLFNKLQAHYKVILMPMLRQLETLCEREKSGNTQLATLRKEIAEIKQQM